MKKMICLAVLVMLSACGDDDAPPPVDMGTGPVDAGPMDANVDTDLGTTDDAGATDDLGVTDDAGPGVDAGPPSPVATINHPADGETRPPSVPFVGVGVDIEDGALTGASLVWTSDVDGMLGTGAMLTATLTPGTNVVTLTATDSMGNTGTDTVTLTITP